MNNCSVMRWGLLKFLPWTIIVLFMISGLESAAIPNFANETDKLALLDFKNHVIDDPLRIMDSWNDSFPFCNWVGVTCNQSTGRVLILNLESSNLVGTVPPSIGNLTFLTGINLQNNSFRGELTQEIGKLLRLRHLNLSTNSFTGMIPTNLSHCINLEVLDIISNKLVGSIPDQLVPLSKLLYIGLAVNNLTGRIPAWIGNFSSLLALSLARNNLHGDIPQELGGLRRLLFFQLYGNQLSGIIPASIFNISSINYFSVTQNRLQGQLPPDVGLTLPNLEVFAGAVNNFSGGIPLSFPNASKLQVIDFSQNALVGSVPTNLGRLQDLSRIDFDANRLGNGTVGDLNFLMFLANCTRLEVLSFSRNFLGGEIHTIANFSASLKTLVLFSNLIVGTIPVGIGNLINLTLIVLGENYLTGSIPHAIGKLQKLEGLYLNVNQFSGQIPSSIGNLTLLTKLFMEENELQGSIPPSLGLCKKLLVLNLTSNNLSGIIPKEVTGLSSLAISLAMADNSLTGSLPTEVGGLTNLKELNLDRNMLTGKIPSALGRCQSLESLFMHGNLLEGTIPESLENLRGLTEIDLSGNNLSGRLPNYLGKLPFLQKLNLSFNDFGGEISKEGVFANASAVSMLGNTRLCGGVPGLHLPPCSLDKSSSSAKLLSPTVVVPLTILIVVLMILCAFVAYAIRRLRKRPLAVSSTKYWELGTSYQELFEYTNGFSQDSLIGSGGFGSVYKGVIRADNAIVAVKVLNLQQKGASKSFIDEFNALKRVRHRNLLKILSACSSVDHHGNDFQGLVFKFMSNGNLEQWLHPTSIEPNMKTSLSFIQRLNIAIEVAYALDYLHRDCPTPIAHCDLKPSNILLDEDMTAYVADFGLAMILFQSSDISTSQSISVALKGSVGYIPPEYAMGGEITTLGDVYSYGILLLEMLTGKRPTDDSFKYGLNLHQFVATALPELVMDVVDPSLVLKKEEKHIEFEEDMIEEESLIINYNGTLARATSRMEECLVSLMKIGVSCSNHLPSSRMPMYVVVNQMHSIRDSFLSVEAGS